MNGLARSYEEKYFQELKSRISEEKFIECIQRINGNLDNMWPCCFCFSFGFLACLTTGGLSFLCPWICIRDAQEQLFNDIKNINETIFNERGLKISYKNICLTSWLQIDLLDYNSLNNTLDASADEHSKEKINELAEIKEINN